MIWSTNTPSNFGKEKPSLNSGFGSYVLRGDMWTTSGIRTQIESLLFALDMDLIAVKDLFALTLYVDGGSDETPKSPKYWFL